MLLSLLLREDRLEQALNEGVGGRGEGAALPGEVELGDLFARAALLGVLALRISLREDGQPLVRGRPRRRHHALLHWNPKERGHLVSLDHGAPVAGLLLQEVRLVFSDYTHLSGDLACPLENAGVCEFLHHVCHVDRTNAHSLHQLLGCLPRLLFLYTSYPLEWLICLVDCVGVASSDGDAGLAGEAGDLALALERVAPEGGPSLGVDGLNEEGPLLAAEGLGRPAGLFTIH